jgi:hypothetical protein
VDYLGFHISFEFFVFGVLHQPLLADKHADWSLISPWLNCPKILSLEKGVKKDKVVISRLL